MRGTYVLGIAFSGVLLGCGLGCGDSPSGPPPTSPAAVVPEKLPELDEPFGPLDGDRLNVPPPKGWYIAPRSSDYVVRFQADMAIGYPMIVVTAEDFTQTRNVDKGNVGQFVEQIAEALKADPKVSKLAAPVKPVELAGRQYVTHHRRAKVKHKIIERVFFETVVAGRKYAIELRTYKGTVDRYRPHAMAVAGATEFLEDDAVEPVATPTEVAKPTEAATPTETTEPAEPVATPKKAGGLLKDLPEGDFEDEL